MVTIQFFLKNPKERKSPIYIAVHVKGKRLTPISIGESILCDSVDKKGKAIKGDWDKDKQRVRKSHDFADEINHKIEGIYLSVGRTFRQMLERREVPTGEDLQAQVKPGKNIRSKSKPKTIAEFAELWKASVLAKENRGIEGWQKLPEKMQKGYNVVRKVRPLVERLNRFRPDITLADLIPDKNNTEGDATPLDNFFEWLQTEYPNLQDTSLNNYAAALRWLLKFAGLPYDWVAIPKGNKATKYSLTWEEIIKLKEANYSSVEMQNAAEVAVIISQLALRWSDFSTLKEFHFEQVKSKKHGMVWCINKNQTKTGNAIMIPAPPIAESLLIKHNFKLPIPATKWGVAYRNVLSDHMKSAAKEAKLDRLIRQTKTINRKVQEYWEPINEVLSPHDLRHTGATLIAQASKSRDLAKYLLGHSGDGVIDDYIHIDMIDDLLDAWKKIEAGN